jgi:inosose dehydratase
MGWERWSYMDHWSTLTPQGLRHPQFNREHTDRYLRQLEALRFTGFDTFAFSLPTYAALYGSVKDFDAALKAHGFHGLTGVFQAYPYATQFTAPHRRETHDRIVSDFERIANTVDGLDVENVIVMPTNTYFHVAPVTDETIKVTAELWNRVGALLTDRGLKLGCHFEFWGAIRTEDELDLFMRETDPETVGFFVDTAQHTIAGVDPLAMFQRYTPRVRGFHFKDTQQVDTEEAYLTPPDAEIMAAGVERWFHEMGTDKGLVDFPAIMRAIVESGFDGWLTVEHDKADIGGGDFAEATCVARWYMDNVLDAVLEETR